MRIVTRSFALIFIGFFHANMETYNDPATLLPNPFGKAWPPSVSFLSFLDYSKGLIENRRYLFQGFGIALLLLPCAYYKSTDPNHPGCILPGGAYWG
jgi:hypothetical protein